MITALKNKMLSFGVKLYIAIKKRYEQEEWRKTKSQFKHIGKNANVSYPWRIKSPQYNCVIAGNPARIIKMLIDNE